MNSFLLRKKIVIGIIIMFIGVSVLPIINSFETVDKGIIWVPDHYTTIQAAVNAANAGDTIIVRNGICIENIIVNKQLTIKSLNGPDSEHKKSSAKA